MMSTEDAIKARRDFLAGIITTAVEGGIGYWSYAEDYRWYFPSISGGSAEPGPHGSANAHVVLLPNNDEESDFPRTRVDMQMIAGALDAIVRDTENKLVSPRVRGLITDADLDNEGGDIDADLADCIMQIAVFGEVRYG